MTIDKIKEILPKQIYEHWMDCRDLPKMQAALKELRWMLDNKEELLLTDNLVNRYHAEVELLQMRTLNIPSSEIKII